MKVAVRFMRKRGVGTVLSLLLGIASIAIGVALGNRWGSPWGSVCLYAVGLGLIILAIVCFIIGPADEPAAETPGKRVDSDPRTNSQGNVARTDKEIGMKVPPETPFLVDGLPPDTTLSVSASEELHPDDEEGETSEP